MRKLIIRSLGMIAASIMCALNAKEGYYAWSAMWLIVISAMAYQLWIKNKTIKA